VQEGLALGLRNSNNQDSYLKSNQVIFLTVNRIFEDGNNDPKKIEMVQRING
jgi:hypothetical protein